MRKVRSLATRSSADNPLVGSNSVMRSTSRNGSGAEESARWRGGRGAASGRPSQSPSIPYASRMDASRHERLAYPRQPACPSRTPTHSPVSLFVSRALLSKCPDATSLPSGEKANPADADRLDGAAPISLFGQRRPRRPVRRACCRIRFPRRSISRSGEGSHGCHHHRLEEQILRHRGSNQPGRPVSGAAPGRSTPLRGRDCCG